MRYNFTKRNKTLAFILIGIGLISIVYGFISNPHRAWANLLLSNFYLMAIALAGTFFLAVQYVAQAGWAVGLKRVLQAMGMYLPFAGIFMLLIFLFGGHDLYHWTHESLYIEKLPDGTPNPEYDEIIAGKSGYLNTAFYLARMIAYFAIWIGFAYLLRKESLREDLDGDIKHYNKSVKYSAIFIVLFAITSSTSAWDFIMSIDTHWYSTLFGWYTFAGLFVTGLSVITLLTLYLKSQGYLEKINENHFHDLGKFMFGFSIFWTYLWFSQFMLIWYANIPEEVAYYQMRWEHYKFLWVANLLINFFFPFLVLMSRDAKRKMRILTIVAIVLLIGHWIDIFLMVMPGTVGHEWNIGLVEIGTTLGFAGLFILVVFRALSKAPLVPQKHPMLIESVHHHI